MAFTERLIDITDKKCVCYSLLIRYRDFNSSFLGVDETNGRFAEVTIETCAFCGTKWIKYLVEYEGFPGSGRWYRGIINDEDLEQMVPEKTVEYLESLPWFIFGGSYFSSTGMYGREELQVDM